MTATGRQAPVLEAVAAADAAGVPGELARSPGTFAWRVRGDAMIDEEFHDGDLIVAQSTPEAREGETVLARVRGMPTVRQFHRREGKVVLYAEDEGLPPIVAEEEDVELHGVVVAVVRKYP